MMGASIFFYSITRPDERERGEPNFPQVRTMNSPNAFAIFVSRRGGHKLRICGQFIAPLRPFLRKAARIPSMSNASFVCLDAVWVSSERETQRCNQHSSCSLTGRWQRNRGQIRPLHAVWVRNRGARCIAVHAALRRDGGTAP